MGEVGIVPADSAVLKGRSAMPEFIVETIENRAGAGLITREMRAWYPFIRVK